MSVHSEGLIWLHSAWALVQLADGLVEADLRHFPFLIFWLRCLCCMGYHLKLYLGFPRFCLFCSFGSLLNLSASKRFVWNTKSLTIPRNYPMTCLQISSHSLPFPYPPFTMSSLRNKIADTRWSLWMLYKYSIFSYRMDSIEWSTRALIFIILNRFNIWRKVFKYITLERKASWWNRDRGGEKTRRACFCCVGGKVRKWSPSEL